MKIFKKQLSLFLAFVILFSSLPSLKINAEEKSLSNISIVEKVNKSDLSKKPWNEEDFLIVGDSFKGLSQEGKEKLKAKDGALEFPNIINGFGHKVKNIANSSFQRLEIKSVKFPDQISEIGNQAFYDNKIESLEIPNSVKKIGYSAFSKNEIKSLKLSESCEELVGFVFEYNKLEEVIIPDCVKTITRAFENNTGSKDHNNKVVLHIKDVDKITFQNCNKEDYYIIQKIDNLYHVEDFILRESARRSEGLTLIGLSEKGKVKAKNNHNLNIPYLVDGKEIKTIGQEAFKELSFENVELPNSIRVIKDAAFAGNSLKAVNLPSELEEIEQNAFCYNKLTTLFIPNSVKKIGLNAFAGNELSEVKIDNKKNSISIGAFAFDNQENTTAKITYLQVAKEYNIKLSCPEGANLETSPSQKATEGEKVRINYNITDASKEFLSLKVNKSKYSEVKLTNNTFIMPSNDVTIELKVKDKYVSDKWCAEDFTFAWEDLEPYNEDSQAYYSIKGFSEKGIKKLEKLKDVVLPKVDAKGTSPSWIWENAFEGKKIDSLVVPGNYTHIQSKAFKNCEIKKITLNEGLLYVNDSGFEANELEEIIFPKGFKYPSRAAFKGNKLKKVVLVDSCESIGPESFMDNEIENLSLGNKTSRIWAKAFKNNKITEVSIPVTLNNSNLSKDAFDNNPGKDNPLRVGDKKVILWTPNKNNPKNIEAGNNFIVDPVVKTKEDLEFNAKDFKYSGDKVEDFSKEGLKKYKSLGTDAIVKLPKININGKAIIGVEDYGFEDIEPQIKKIEIPEGYKSIGDQAFSSSAITEVNLPDSIESVGDNAFLNYDNINVKLYVSSETIKNKIGEDGSFWTIFVKENSKKEDSKWSAEDFTYKNLEGTIEERSSKKITLNAVSGFSDKGLEKIKTEKDLILPTKDINDKKVEAVYPTAFQNSPSGKQRIKHLQIPEGYKYIGQMAFAFNGIEGEVKLPDSLEDLGQAVFFRNNITSIIIPENIGYIPDILMRGNKLSKVVIKGKIESIGRLAFAENKLEEIQVPDSLKTIGEQAFETNIGLDAYNNKVVIRTKSGNNPNNIKDAENYLIDPKSKGEGPKIDYNDWTLEDFTYDGNKIKGFSKAGLTKIRRNKNLVLPDKTPDGDVLKIIGIDAFRNLNRGFDIESVKIPDTVEEIEDYALQFNDIKEVTLPRGLKKLGMGVFMNCNTQKVIFNEKLEYIDQACFYNDPLEKIELPSSIHTIMNAAFRKCSLTEVSFKGNSKLKKIESLAFADNNLSNICFPEGLEYIGEQAFGNNKFTSVTLPESINKVGHQAFLNNPNESSPVAVVITTKSKNITDDLGGTFVVNPNEKAGEKDKDVLRKEVELAEKIDKEKLTKDFKNYFEKLLKDAKEALEDSNVSKTKITRFTKEVIFANKRSKISILMFAKEKLDEKKDDFDTEKWKQVEKCYKAAKNKIMVVDITDAAVDQIINDLELALKALNNEENPLKDAVELDGEANVPETHYIKPYTIKVKVWVSDGKIINVTDNNTITDDESEDEEHNKGYFNKALEIMMTYKGKDVKSVLNNESGIDTITGATVSSNTIHAAILNALSKLGKEDLPSLNKDVLIEKIREAKEIEQGEKTDEAFKNLTDAIKLAEDSIDNLKSQEDIEAEISKLDSAIKTFKASKNKVNPEDDQELKPDVNPEDDQGLKPDVNPEDDQGLKPNVNPDIKEDNIITFFPSHSRKESSTKVKASVYNEVKEINNEIIKEGQKETLKEETNYGFMDISNHWAKDAIIYVVEKGYFKGTSANSFSPNKAITRADFVTVLGRMAKIEQKNYNKNIFKDLDNNYYTCYVIWAFENGIVSGVGDGKFEPNRQITREEMAIMMSKFLKVIGKDISTKKVSPFKDNANISNWAKEYVEEMAEKGIIKGMEDGRFSPKSNFTRAQVSQVLYSLDKIK